MWPLYVLATSDQYVVMLYICVTRAMLVHYVSTLVRDLLSWDRWAVPQVACNLARDQSYVVLCEVRWCASCASCAPRCASQALYWWSELFTFDTFWYTSFFKVLTSSQRRLFYYMISNNTNKTSMIPLKQYYIFVKRLRLTTNIDISCCSFLNDVNTISSFKVVISRGYNNPVQSLSASLTAATNV